MTTFTKTNAAGTTTYTMEQVLQAPRGRYKLDGVDYVYIDVRSPTAASWVFWYRRNGRKPELGLGSAYRNCLKPAFAGEVKRLATIYAADLLKGRDPKTHERTGKTFNDLLLEEIEMRSEKKWGEGPTWLSWAKNYFPGLLKLRPHQIDRMDVVDALRAGWKKNRETASRARYVIENVIERARAEGLFPDDTKNPADASIVEKLLGAAPTAADAVPHPAYPHADMPALMARILAPKTSGWRMMGHARKALSVVVTIPHRAAEVFGMKWADLTDTEEGLLWEPKADDNKQGRAQANILPWQVEAIIRSIPKKEGNPFVFTGQEPGTHITSGGMLYVLRKDMKVPAALADIHGFRSTITTWGQDVFNANDETLANMISHGAITGKHFKRYARGQKLKQRATVSQAWADNIFPVDFCQEDGVRQMAA